jgi:ribosomal protein S18 acetylase RimI-like enzyme
LRSSRTTAAKSEIAPPEGRAGSRPSSTRDGLAVALVCPDDPATFDAIKAIADKHRDELGFHTRQAFIDSASQGELIVATLGRSVAGFVRFHKRRDHAATIYEIATDPARRRRGVAKQLIEATVKETRRLGARTLRLSCPAELAANDFYLAVGFSRVSPRGSTPGNREKEKRG